MTAESALGHPMGSDNYEHGGVQVPSTSAHSNEVIETGSSVNAVAGFGEPLSETSHGAA